jgi:hypothetical protein
VGREDGLHAMNPLGAHVWLTLSGPCIVHHAAEDSLCPPFADPVHGLAGLRLLVLCDA